MSPNNMSLKELSQLSNNDLREHIANYVIDYLGGHEDSFRTMSQIDLISGFLLWINDE